MEMKYSGEVITDRLQIGDWDYCGNPEQRRRNDRNYDSLRTRDLWRGFFQAAVRWDIRIKFP